ncbi:hypothetical protein [Arthrobacter sp. ISL-30]|uniref:hypothetical protein n=1 Tax=Arthrobacter sp. ISL-30 TaxID=2819109 RepID=UPI001BE4F005|nr:hypothetical protein [Arthrobacter sp. ISL-30]MBT2513315.1 hypothetical protein [Arthrobacter sp. ISL-30]
MSQQPWRETVPEETALDMENLLGTGIGAAREQLENHGWFLPFALVVENDGDVRILAVAPQPAAEPELATEPESAAEPESASEFDANAMLSDLAELLRQNRGDFRAAALVCDITLVEEDSDAIHVAAEHEDGSVFAAVLPYAPGNNSGWEFGELAADENEPIIWAD